MKNARDISKIARELAEGNPLGYKKIRAMLKKAAPLSRQRFYQVKHKIMGLCMKCNRELAKDNASYCEYHKVATRKAVAARNKGVKNLKIEEKGGSMKEDLKVAEMQSRIDEWAESQKQADEADIKYGYGKGKWHWADYCGGYCAEGNHIHAADCDCQECEDGGNK